MISKTYTRSNGSTFTITAGTLEEVEAAYQNQVAYEAKFQSLFEGTEKDECLPEKDCICDDRQPYEGICPNCGAIWGVEEFDWERCFACGYPNFDSDFYNAVYPEWQDFEDESEE